MTDKNKEVAIGGTSILHKSDSFDQVQAVANYLQKAKQELGDCPAYQKLQSAVYEKAAKLSASTQNIDAEFFSLRETARIECKNAQNALKKELTLTVSNPKKASEKAWSLAPIPVPENVTPKVKEAYDAVNGITDPEVREIVLKTFAWRRILEIDTFSIKFSEEYLRYMIEFVKNNIESIKNILQLIKSQPSEVQAMVRNTYAWKKFTEDNGFPSAREETVRKTIIEATKKQR